MARVTIHVNDKPYVIGCEDGGEAHLMSLVQRIDAKVRQVAPEAGGLGDTRLMLVAALMIADDLYGAEARLADCEGRITETRTSLADMEERVVAILEGVADRLDALAPDLNTGQLQLL
jgi:cell division protein ZapA